MNTSLAKHSRQLILLSASAAFIALLPSCLPPPPRLHVRAVLSEPGYYDTLPRDYNGEYYQYQNRYYYGGRHETGRYRSDGQVYGDRYYHGGRYYYGGQHFIQP